MTTRILFIDDHALFREGLVHVLRELDQDLDVIHAATAPEAIAAASYYQGLDLILLDRSLAGSDGISILAQLREAANGTPVVVVSGSGGASDVRRALDAGAASYVPKAVGVKELLIVLRRVLNGESYLPASLLAAMAPANDTPILSESIKLDKLTQRQKDVLFLLSQGLSNKGIANRLDLSEGAVKHHVSAIMRSGHG